MRCPVCNQENPPGARFCLACGVALEPEAPPQEERRIVSIIFVDLVGSTAQAEVLDPEDVRALLTPYHQLVRREIESFGGVVEKFIGDAIMGVFGAPVAYGDDAERAVRAAFVVRDSVCAMPGSNLQIRIAVNTGEAVVSLNARPAFGESMVAGDVVNTASRLQSQAPVNGIVVGEMTYLGTRDVIGYEATEPIVAKGKAAPVKAWLATTPLTPAGQRATRDLPHGRPRARTEAVRRDLGSRTRRAGRRIWSRCSARPASASRPSSRTSLRSPPSVAPGSSSAGRCRIARAASTARSRDT